MKKNHGKLKIYKKGNECHYGDRNMIKSKHTINK